MGGLSEAGGHLRHDWYGNRRCLVYAAHRAHLVDRHEGLCEETVQEVNQQGKGQLREGRGNTAFFLFKQKFQSRKIGVV